jgi:hypothetical protein
MQAQPSPRAMKPMRHLCDDANTCSSYCLRTAGIPLPKLSGFWPMIAAPFLTIVCVPR